MTDWKKWNQFEEESSSGNRGAPCFVVGKKLKKRLKSTGSFFSGSDSDDHKGLDYDIRERLCKYYVEKIFESFEENRFPYQQIEGILGIDWHKQKEQKKELKTRRQNT